MAAVVHIVSLTLVALFLQPRYSQSVTVCQGSNSGIHNQEQTSSQAAIRYQRYRTVYTNCTFVDGNLELVFLDQEDNYDLSFLSEIQEIAGYLLVVNVHADYLHLNKLRIIRGHHLYAPDNGQYYALYMTLNYLISRPGVGIKELQFQNLHEIMAGDVLLHDNRDLCHHNTINWYDILTGEGAKYSYSSMTIGEEPRVCGDCDVSCEDPDHPDIRHCWGHGPEMCQTLTKEKCSDQCESRCFGRNPNQCCHPECAGGCSGPTKNDCYACKNFADGDQCVPYCPKPYIYKDTEWRSVPNPNMKYTFGSLCVKDCPSYLLKEKEHGFCVKTCSAGQRDIDKFCVDCNGPCPKTCMGTGIDFLNADNLEDYRDCTVIEGSLRIVPSTFKGDKYFNIPGMNVSALAVFEKVKVITDYLLVQASHPDFKSLSFLKNLHTINGRKKDDIGASLHIYESSLESFDLVSLKKVESGMILVALNPNLCYAENIDWTSIKNEKKQRINVQQNQNKTLCASKNAVCDAECSEQGCWGPGNNQCLSCANYHLDNLCIQACEASLRLFDAGNKTCGKCDPQCANTCEGQGPGKCDACKQAQDGPYCIAKCPETKYLDKNGTCQLCDPSCLGGCTGPSKTLGQGGCNTCAVGVVAADGFNITMCLPHDTVHCGKGYFMGSFSRDHPKMAGKQVCKMCDDLCETCSGPGPTYCEECKYFEQNTACKRKCSMSHYPDVVKKKCSLCHDYCNGCYGGTTQDCKKCYHLKVYLGPIEGDSNHNITAQFNCTKDCPQHLKYVMTEDDHQSVCVASEGPVIGPCGNNTGIVIGMVVSILFIMGFMLIVIAYCWRQRALSKEYALVLTARMTDMEESEGLWKTSG